MSEYPNLAELRGELTADDPDRRASAYQSVMEAGFQVSEVLSTDPPIDGLAEAGVVPTEEAQNRTPAVEHRARIVELLEEIRDAVQGGA